MSRAAFWLSLVVPAALAVAYVCGTAWPLGVSDEWVWLRQSPPDLLWLTLLPPLALGAGYVALVGVGARRVEAAGTWERSGWLGALVAAGFAWLWVVQESATEGYQLSKAAWILYYPGPSGYFTAARTDGRTAREFLATYERQMAAGDVLHIGTHPPGLTLFFRAMLEVCRASPRLVELAVASEPESVSSSMELLEQLNRHGEFPLLRYERAALWLAALSAQALAALTVLPLYGLLRLTCGRKASWLAMSFWPAVPALAVFLPKSDAAFPCLAALIVLIWLLSLERRSATWGALAGFVFWLALLFSLAFLPLALFAFVLTLWGLATRKADEGEATRLEAGGWRIKSRIARSECAGPLALCSSGLRDSGSRSLVPCLVGAAVGFVAPCVLLRWLGGINLLAVWSWNLHNHAGFYDKFARTYWKWLLVNPVEFAVAVGPPLVALAVWGALQLGRRAVSAALGVPAAFMATWGALWLSGKNSGEAARLWTFLTPFVVWMAGPIFDAPATTGRDTSAPQTASQSWRLAALALQLTVCAALVLRVGGFDFLK